MSKENENTDIKKFISEVSQKNYAEANKYLQAALEDKVKSLEPLLNPKAVLFIHDEKANIFKAV